MTNLRPLKIIELRDIFRTLDSGNKGSLDKSDLEKAFTLLGSRSGLDQDGVGYVLDHLIQVGNCSFNNLGNNPNSCMGSKNTQPESLSSSLGDSNSGGTDGIGTLNPPKNRDSEAQPKLDLTTFVDAVNHVLSTNSLEVLLKSTFDSISVPSNDSSNGGASDSGRSSHRSTSSTSSSRVVTVPQLLDLARRFGLKLSKDSEIRLQARVPNGSVNFTQFVELVSST